MEGERQDFARAVGNAETANGAPASNITNLGYSPVLIKKNEENKKRSEPVYMEMGVVNPSYVAEQKEKKHSAKLSSFNPEIPLQLNTSQLQTKMEPVLDEDNYLTPAKSTKRPPISPVKAPPNPHYEDLEEMASKVHYDTPRGSFSSAVISGVAMGASHKKRNMVYEPSQIKKKEKTKKSTYVEESDISHYDLPCWLILALLIVGLLAVLAIILFLLLLGGTVKPKGCSCDQDSNQGSVGMQSQRSYLNDTKLSSKIQQLESNLTSLKQKIEPQRIEIERLKNVTEANEILITYLRDSLKQEQMKVQDLNLTVGSFNEKILVERERVTSLNKTIIQIKNLHDALQSSTDVLNQTLEADLLKNLELEKQLDIQKISISSINHTSDVISLRSGLQNEVSHRQGNDTVLSQLIKENSVARQSSIANLTSDLAALTAKSLKDIEEVEKRLNISIATNTGILEKSDERIASHLLTVNQTLLNLITNVSLTPGPQGQPGKDGAGNMSRCIRTEREMSHDVHSLKQTVNLGVPDTNVIVGAFCYASLPAGIEWDTWDPSNPTPAPNLIIKQCKCNLLQPATEKWYCRIRVWSCPKNS